MRSLGSVAQAFLNEGKMKYFIVIIISGIILLNICCQQNTPEKLILGAWKVDSTYNFYNGFEYRQTDDGRDWATYLYESNGTVKEIKYGTYRPYAYYFKKEALIWIPKYEKQTEIPFQILALTKKRMVLKRYKDPIFAGDQQTRYEIRYFSRTDPPKDAVELYQPPSQNDE